MRCGGGAASPLPGSNQVVDTIAPLQHINHVLGKLGAANRTEAVDRARRTALIP
jgi:hypothetical protein